MEDSGKCMVAIIQGVYDAGIAVTLVNDVAEQNISNLHAINDSHSAPEKIALVGTNTDFPEQCDTSSQICDGHFASTYQTAHCGIKPTSPPVQLSEIPPQRLEPDAGQGHFEIGSIGAQGYHWSPQTSYWSNRELVSADRGTLNSFRGNDAFAQSLRKYPNVQTGKLSDELIQRLLTYTQAKNMTKSSYHTKVMRSMSDRHAAADKDTRTNSSKNIQTYARTRKNCKENGNTTDKDIKFGENSSKIKNIPHESNILRSKDSNVNFTYDYLRGSSPVRSVSGRSADVRYLTDVKKYIRETVRQMCQERTNVCPRIRSRYSNHRREHHRSSVEQELNNDSNNTHNTKDRASSPLLREVSEMTQCEVPPNHFQTCIAEVNRCCICKKPLPCSCRPGPSKESTKGLSKSACIDNSSEFKDKIMNEIITRWIQSIPVYANESKRDKVKRDEMVIELIEVLEKTITDDNLQLKKVLDDFLDDLPMWRPSNDNERKMFKNELAVNLIEQLKFMFEKDVISIEIAKWIKNIHFEHDKAGMMTKDDVAQALERKIKSVKRNPNDGDYKEALISVITKVLQDLPIEKGGDKHGTYQLASNLANNLITLERNNQGLFENIDGNMSEDVKEDLRQSIIDEVSNIFDNTDINLTKSKKAFLQNKIAKILHTNIQSLRNNNITDKIKKKIVDLLEEETDIQGPQADIFANNFINKVKFMSLPDQRKTSKFVPDSSQLKDNIKESIKEEVNDIFNKFNIKVEDRETLIESISNLLDDEIVRGIDVNRDIHEIYSLLQDANVSEEHAESISDELASRAREISLSYKTKDSTLSLNTRAQLHKDSFKKNVARVLFDFIKTIDINDRSKLKAKQVLQKLIDNVAEIIFHYDYDKNAVFNEILTFLEKLPFKSKIPKEELGGQLMKKLQSLNIHTSTPRKERFSFRPHRESTDSTISSISFEHASTTNPPVTENDEDNYNKELSKIFSDWVDGLPVDLIATDAKTFRETMINDLVADMIDRQKYFQLKPIAKMSEKDEFEHLKYQVFRWFNKLPNGEDVPDIILKTEELFDRVNIVPVPTLVNPVGQRKNIKLREGKIPTYMDALEDELSIWLDEIPKDLRLFMNKSQLDRAITELAGKIQEINNTEANIEEEIRNWLRKITKSVSDSKLNKFSKSLLNRLESKGFTDETNWIIVQNTSQFIEENFNGALKDWLKDLPLYQTGNSQQRFVQEEIVSDLAKDMRRVFDSLQSTSPNIDSDKLIIDGIMKHLKRFPMEIPNKTDENYIKSVAYQLLNFLKGLQIFQDISFRQITSSDVNLETNIEDWLLSLGLAPRNSIEKNHLQELTKQFKVTIKQLKKNHANKQIILDQIVKYLSALPIEFSRKNNDRFLNDKALQLLNNLESVSTTPDELSRATKTENIMSNVQSNLVTKHDLKKTTNILYENIESWCEELPIYCDDTTEDKNRVKMIKQNIATKLINKISELNMDPEILYDDFIYDDLLKDEIESILSVLPMNKDNAKSYENLKLSLFNKVKEVKEKTKTELAGHLYKQRLRDAISKTLSLDEIIPEDDEGFFQNLREDIADAFINLHYFGTETELKNKFRNKISEEIYEFCNNYLKRYPAKPIDTSKLNKELYSALKNVPLPTEESIRNEVEQTRIKDKVQDCMKELPLKTETMRDKQRINKITSIMSKRLLDIEKKKKLISNYTEELKTEIMTWLKKIPLKPEGERELERFAEKIIIKLKNSEGSREFSPQLIQSYDQELSDSSNRSDINISHSQSFPHSSLTPEDQALLKHVRERNISNKKINQRHKDASINPPPIDVESQTELRHSDSSTMEFGVQQTSSVQAGTQVEKTPKMSSISTQGENKQRECDGPCVNYAEDRDKSMPGFNTNSKNHLEVSPRVTVKEYHWNSTQDMSSPCQMQPCVDPSGLGRPLINQKPDSSSISSTPRPQRFLSHTSRYLHSQENHEEQSETNKTPNPKLIQPGLDQPSSMLQRTFRRPLRSLDAVQGSDLQRFDSEWSSDCFPDYNDFRRTASSRRHVVPSQENISQPYKIIGGKGYDKAGCKCRECMLTKCSGRNRSPSCENHEDSLKQCPKCCGAHCPYPSYLYFKK